MNIDISIEYDEWKTQLPDAELLIHRVCKAIFSEEMMASLQHKEVDLSVVLADDAIVQELNKTYRHKDKTTNVLSFPATEMQEGDLAEDCKIPELALGDVILSLDTLTIEANAQKKTLRDHFYHLLVHGILHLLGYDHISEKEANRMESKEIEILHILGVNNPYICDIEL